ncbi:delta-sarcoglycan [Periophthalmus magnuspinnatus]|uniref:delta-sarcoglycan n=1 Tax=Periophthalmus magnuspinnatus TaxID=409849 RepID=UPI0024364507|nr:delta-sarcoglycan [Periophthalmus magnuspinnatus]
MMTQEQCSHRNNVQSSDKPQIYKVGIYGWRKRCLYFFVLLLMILILINLALTIWILKVMNFTIDGMGNLRITEKGLKLEGDSEFLEPLYAKEIQSKPGRPLYLQSSRNVSVNIYSTNNQLLTQLVTGSSGLKARGKAFEVKSTSGKLLFSADEDEVVVGADRLRVMGESKERRHKRDTCILGVEISLDAHRIRLMRLPEGKASSSSSGTRQTVYEVCVCPNGRLFLSQAGVGSTCQISYNVCL